MYQNKLREISTGLVKPTLVDYLRAFSVERENLTKAYRERGLGPKGASFMASREIVDAVIYFAGIRRTFPAP